MICFQIQIYLYSKKTILDIAKNRLNFTSCLLLKMKLAKYNFQVAQQILESLQSNFIYKNTFIQKFQHCMTCII